MPAPWPTALTWFRTSAEYRALALQVYANATERALAAGRDRPRGSWGVILDADETVLDNSEQERRAVESGLGFSDARWVAWVRERAAVPIPGAVAFIQAVQSAGGEVAIVTNRADSLCADTRANLAAIGVRPRLLLCKPNDTGDKNPRFRAVRDGTAPGATGPLDIVAYVGDNIQDFPDLSQASRDDGSALAAFGTRYFILPNPIYGSWR